MTNKERLEDLLIEFDELDMQPMLIVPAPLERAKAWKHELTYTIKHLKAEIAREIFEEIWEMFIPEKSATGCAYYFDMYELAELKNKYIGEQNDG